MSSPGLLTLAEDVGELAQRARLNAIQLAVAAAKVKLADPAFRGANERIIQLVTRATETAAAVERLTRKLSGQPASHEHGDSIVVSLERLEELAGDVHDISGQIVEEMRKLALLGRPRGLGAS